jgi:hypothetical protein
MRHGEHLRVFVERVVVIRQKRLISGSKGVREEGL